MRYLFMFTIGPVKAFIENSRKARDLYAGSKLLSELMEDCVTCLSQDDRIRLLFPAVSDEDAPPNMPNRLVAELTGYTDKQIHDQAERLTVFVKKRFLKKCSGLFAAVGLKLEMFELAVRQLEDFLEVFWVCVEYEEEPYHSAYQRLFTAMQDVKSIRDFSQIREPWGRKCMLYPQYNAIFAKKSMYDGTWKYPYHTNPDYVYDITEIPSLRYMVKEKEALSAVGLVKRLYNRGAVRIYSTRQMLLRKQVSSEMLKEAGILESDAVQMDMVANAVYDLYNENIPVEDEYTAEAAQVAERLYKMLREKQIRLSSYYCIIKFDGDNMGECFRNLETEEEQRQLSSNIDTFARLVPEIFLKYSGLPVFAGGEDFFGFLPLDHMFQCLEELYQKFGKVVGLTFSAGISVAHLMQPLKEVMEQVDSMEQVAKNRDGKQAFAIGIIKRSGETVRLPAFHLPEMRKGPGLKKMGELVRLLQDSGCPKSLFFQIADQLKYFIRENSAWLEPSMVEPLIVKCVSGAFVDDGLISRNELVKSLMDFYIESGSTVDFLNTLNGITFLSREVN